MKWKMTFGLLILLFLTSCSKEEAIYEPLNGPQDISYINKELKDPHNNVLKDFGEINTRVSMTPIWVEGDLISIYSIDEDDRVIFIDTCAVYDVGDVSHHKGKNHYARITAEVAGECQGYFAGYPYDILDLKVGDKVTFPADRNFGHYVDLSRAHLDGTFGNASIMTSWCDWCDNDTDGRFNFRNRCALLQVNNVTDKDFPLTIELPDGYTGTVTSYTEETLYFPIVSEANRNDKISINYKGYYNVDVTPKSTGFKYEIACVYPYDIKDIRLTKLSIEGNAVMKPSYPAARYYCYGILGNGTKVDLSGKSTWTVSPSTSGKITYGKPGEIWFTKEAAHTGTTLKAVYEDFSTTFYISNK